MRLRKDGKLPGFRGQTCGRCKAPIVWARTMASPSGTGGKPMPLDAVPNDDGNVAARWNGVATYARVLSKDDELDAMVEHRAMPHFATCGANMANQVEDWLRERTEGS